MRLRLQHRVDHAVDLDGLAGVVLDLSIPGGHHCLKIGKVAQREPLMLMQEDVLAGGIPPLFQRRQQDPCQVDEAHAGATVAPLARHRRLDATDGGILIGILRADTELDEFGDHDLIVVECRHTKATADHLHTGIEKLAAHSGMVTHAQVRLGGAQTTTGFQNGVGERVDRILRHPIDQELATDGHILIERTTGRGFGVGAGADLADLQQLEPAALQQLDGLFPRQGAGG